MIRFRNRGDFKNTEKFLNSALKMKISALLNEYGKRGVNALSSATPKDTGLTADSWEYEIEQTSRGYSITWSNANVVDGVVIALILQYGHGTGNGGYIEGRDYINPAMQPIFDAIANELGEEVSKL